MILRKPVNKKELEIQINAPIELYYLMASSYCKHAAKCPALLVLLYILVVFMIFSIYFEDFPLQEKTSFHTIEKCIENYLCSGYYCAIIEKFFKYWPSITDMTNTDHRVCLFEHLLRYPPPFCDIKHDGN